MAGLMINGSMIQGLVYNGNPVSAMYNGQFVWPTDVPPSPPTPTVAYYILRFANTNTSYEGNGNIRWYGLTFDGVSVTNNGAKPTIVSAKDYEHNAGLKTWTNNNINALIANSDTGDTFQHMGKQLDIKMNLNRTPSTIQFYPYQWYAGDNVKFTLQLIAVDEEDNETVLYTSPEITNTASQNPFVFNIA